MVKMTERAQRALIRRTYRCDECSYEFRWTHASADEPYPDCPRCAAVGPAYQPPMPAIVGNKAKAIDIAQKIGEEMGLTDMNDNMRPGDIAAKGPAPIQAAEREAITRELIEAGVAEQQAAQVANPGATSFWQGSMGAGSPSPTGGGSISDTAKVASAEQKSQGVDAVGLLEKGRETGSMKMKFNVMGSA